MARGWESKPAEAQTGVAVAQTRVPENAPDPHFIALLRKKETILLSRTRVVRELGTAQNPRYRAVLAKALADLDAQLSALVVD
jgi:hypothetical protein